MSTSDTNNNLLREMLGKGSAEAFTTAAQTGKDFYTIHFPIQSVISTITMANVTNSNLLNKISMKKHPIKSNCLEKLK